MWCVGARKIPHASQNTNAAIESYHSNLKSILNSAKEMFVGRRMDWLIYHLTCEVLTHYWYGVQSLWIRPESQARGDSCFGYNSCIHYSRY